MVIIIVVLIVAVYVMDCVFAAVGGIMVVITGYTFQRWAPPKVTVVMVLHACVYF
jgi:hypothetical protein